VAAAFLSGLMAERGLARAWAGRLAALIAADLTVFVFGVTWLGAVTGMAKAVVLGFVPFVVGDALKVIVAWGVLEGVSLAARRREKPAG
ncbi:MAG TPA: biotin transporter BioY, partial [bacterium]|nr:biotin transporter BioY [bacterium]